MRAGWLFRGLRLPVVLEQAEGYHVRPGFQCYILPALETVGYRRGGNRLTHVEVPQRLPILRIERGEDALVAAGENQPSGCREQARAVSTRANLLKFPLK